MGLYLGRQIGEKDSDVLHKFEKHVNEYPQTVHSQLWRFNAFSFEEIKLRSFNNFTELN